LDPRILQELPDPRIEPFWVHEEQIQSPGDTGEGIVEIMDHHLEKDLLEPFELGKTAVGFTGLGHLVAESALNFTDPEQGPDPRQEFDPVYGPAQKIIGSGLYGAKTILAVVQGRDHENRRFGPALSRLDPPANLETVHTRHHHIDHDQMGPILLHRSQGCGAAGHREDMVRLPGQQGLEEAEIPWIVVHEEDPGLGLHSTISPAMVNGFGTAPRGPRPWRAVDLFGGVKVEV